MTEELNHIRRYKIGNAPRPSIGDWVRVPFKGPIKRAVVLDFTQDEILVEVAISNAELALREAKK